MDKLECNNIWNDIDEGDTVFCTVMTKKSIIWWRTPLPKAIARLPVIWGSKSVGIPALRNILMGEGNNIPATLRNLGPPLARMYCGIKKIL